MIDRPRDFGNVLVGLLLGGTFGYLCSTEEGRRVLDRVEFWLDDVIDQVQRLQSAAAKARNAVDEGRQSFGAAIRMTSRHQDQT